MYLTKFSLSISVSVHTNDHYTSIAQPSTCKDRYMKSSSLILSISRYKSSLHLGIGLVQFRSNIVGVQSSLVQSRTMFSLVYSSLFYFIIVCSSPNLTMCRSRSSPVRSILVQFQCRSFVIYFYCIKVFTSQGLVLFQFIPVYSITVHSRLA